MSPPTYENLGKQARDLFAKGYHHGLIKLETPTGENKTVAFKTETSHNLTNEKLAGNIDLKYKIPQHGLTLIEKWSTDGALKSILELDGQLARGLKATLESSYFCNTGKRDALIKTEWANDSVKLNANLTLIGGPVASLSGVYSHSGFLFGVSSKYDFSTNESKATNVSFGYEHPLYTIHSYTNDGREFGGSIYHHVRKNVELGVHASFVSGEESKASYGVASTYQFSPDLTLRTKIDNKSNVGVAVTHALGPNLKVTISSLFGLSGAGKNTLGCGLEFNA